MDYQNKVLPKRRLVVWDPVFDITNLEPLVTPEEILDRLWRERDLFMLVKGFLRLHPH